MCVCIHHVTCHVSKKFSTPHDYIYTHKIDLESLFKFKTMNQDENNMINGNFCYLNNLFYIYL